MSIGRTGASVTPLNNSKRERFAQEYCVDLNATEAAKRAGYSARTAYSQGCRLLKNAEVAARVAALQDAAADRNALSVDWVLERLADNAERCRQAVEVLDHEGRRTGEWRFDAAGSNRALELLGKHLGMFVERHELTGKNGAPLIPPGRLAPEEIPDRLRALIGRN